MSRDNGETRTTIGALDLQVRDMLKEDLPHQLQSFRAALTAGEITRAAQIVHVVRGSASFCRLDALRSAAAALEESLQECREERALVAVFEARIESVLEMLKNHND